MKKVGEEENEEFPYGRAVVEIGWEVLLERGYEAAVESDRLAEDS